jgi:putative membrane protein
VRVRHLPHLLLLAGIGLLIAVLIDHGLPEILDGVARAGWVGVAAVTAFHLVPLVVDAFAWRVLVTAPDRLAVLTAIRLRWISEAVNSLLPTASVGGDFVRARLATFAGLRPAVAGASVIGDVTLGLITQLVFSLLGLMLLLRVEDANRALIMAVVIGLGTFVVLTGVLLLVLRRGIFSALARRIASFSGAGRWQSLLGGAVALDSAIAALYAQRRVILVSSVWRTIGWIVGAGEIWLGLYFLGHPIPVGEAVLVESLVQAIRTAAFAIPAGIGAQELGFVVVAGAIGVPSPVALALAIIKRARELLLGVSGLLAWQIQEAVRLRQGAKAERATPPAG